MYGVIEDVDARDQFLAKACQFCRTGKCLQAQHVRVTFTKRKGRVGRLHRVYSTCGKCGHENAHDVWVQIVHVGMFTGAL